MLRPFLLDSKRPFSKVVAISDVHAGHVNHDGKRFSETIRYIKEEFLYWFGIGDLLENVTPEKGGEMLTDQRMKPTDQLIYMESLLKPIAHRCLIMIPGNHETRTVKSSMLCPTAVMAKGMNILDRYDPVGGLFQIKQRDRTYKLAIFHGFMGGGEDPFREHKRRLRVYHEADAFLLGHTHYLGHEENVWIDLDEHGKPEARTTHFVRTGTYLKYPDYAKKYGYLPGKIGSPILTFHAKKHKIEVDCSTLSAL